MINHGLASYFKSLLKTSLDRSDVSSFSFDESLNEATRCFGFGMTLRTKSVFAITDQAFLTMGPIKTHSHISMILLKTWTTVIFIKYQWTVLMLM